MPSSLIDDAPGGVNIPEFSVSEISGAVKRMIEGEFGHVRVRGEVGRVSRPRSGHIYLDLKDERSVLAAVVWRGGAAHLGVEPQEGDEVVATGRLTTFPGQSKYQLVIDTIAYAGEGALLAKLERLKKALAAEGLFAPEKKRALPYLPRVIGVVTSPSGAVIRDILHRLAERYPVRVLVWPVAVQGPTCGAEVAAAIGGFCRLAPEGAIPRPDVLIVARGGGSIEDLWGFNDEAAVRAAAACPIPLISAVGHETDTTLIDHAADRRAPTPSAAAEMAVPVRAELVATVAELDGRRLRALVRVRQRARERLADCVRALPSPERLIAERRQSLDHRAARLPSAARLTERCRMALDRAFARMPRRIELIAPKRERFRAATAPLPGALRQRVRDAGHRLALGAAGLKPDRLIAREALARERLDRIGRRLVPVFGTLSRARHDELRRLDRLLGTLGYSSTLKRGYVVVRNELGQVTTRAAAVRPGEALEIEFADDRLRAVAQGPRGKRDETPDQKPAIGSRRSKDGGQGSLF